MERCLILTQPKAQRRTRLGGKQEAPVDGEEALRNNDEQKHMMGSMTTVMVWYLQSRFLIKETTQKVACRCKIGVHVAC